MFKKTTPLIVFVHAPKAAGTTVNAFLKSNFSRGYDHIQNLLQTPKRFSAIINKANWVSGHIAFNKFSAALETATNRKLQYFATIRYPEEQVFSHYNWLIEIHRRGPEFYEAHPQNLKEVSEQIRAADNDDPLQIIEILKRHSGLFLNLQSRFILGDDFDLQSSEFEKRYQNYEMICPVPKLDELYKRLRQSHRKVDGVKNNSPYHVNPVVFKAQSLEKFLKTENSADMKLFSLAMST